MFKYIAMLCVVACLAVATPSMAATQNFGPDFARFSIEVPDGWSAQPNEGGCQITSPDGSTSVSVQVFKSNGKSASELAKLIGDQMGGKIVKTENNGNDSTTVYAELDGVRLAIMVTVSEGKAVVVTMAGTDKEALNKILGSLGDAK
ncbi:MAG: hypothetical protein K5657_04210 [Desulfovibrio sp.]|nr:hypothetical protein [Desulfovibrio sp.]